MNQIHPTAIIETTGKIGHNNIIGPYCVITGHVDIGDNNIIHSSVSIGSPPEAKPSRAAGHVSIGSNNVIREFTTINAPYVGGLTLISDDCYIMARCHVSHDTKLFDSVILSTNVCLGGHTIVMEGAGLGLGAITHQRSIIGAYAYLGMGTIVTKKSIIEPFKKYVGTPARELGPNDVGLQRAQLSKEQMILINIQYGDLRNGLCADPRLQPT